MREFKFRAWDKILKEMFTDFYLNAHGEMVIPDSVYGVDTVLDNYILMQYIGIIGKDKKEIYECDIVKLYNHNQLEIVEYVGSAFGVFLHKNKKRENGDFQNIDEWYPISCPIEVVGNIYETPKLLEQ